MTKATHVTSISPHGPALSQHTQTGLSPPSRGSDTGRLLCRVTETPLSLTCRGKAPQPDHGKHKIKSREGGALFFPVGHKRQPVSAPGTAAAARQQGASAGSSPLAALSGSRGPGRPAAPRQEWPLPTARPLLCLSVPLPSSAFPFSVIFPLTAPGAGDGGLSPNQLT